MKIMWFLKTSWRYLGCDSGTGRWGARRNYFQSIIPTTFRFIKLSWND